MKFGRKDFQLAFKTGTDANKAKFKKECVQGEIYHATDTGFFYIAEVTAGLNDATLSKFGATAFNQYSVDLDGTNDYMQVPIGSAIDMYGLSFWFKPNNIISNSGSHGVVFSPSGNYWLPGFGAIAGAVSDEIISIYIGAVYAYTSPSATISTDWHHCVVAWSSSSATTGGDGYDIWLDGIKVGNASSTTYGSVSLYTIPAQTVRFGVRTSSTMYFQGKLDEIAVFDSVLLSSQITNIYKGEENGGSGGTNGIPGDLSTFSPVGWWRMGDNDGGTGTTITDQGSGGNDGTLINTASPNGIVSGTGNTP
jgi:hypothetical protein